MANESEIKYNLTRILSDVENWLPSETIAEAKSLTEYREFGVAFELICAQLYEFDSSISKDLYQLIELTGKQMKLPTTSWCFLRNLLKDSIKQPV